MAGLSKSRILANRQCPKRLWLQIHQPELLELDGATEARMMAGTHVGEVARNLHPEGLLIEGGDLAQCLVATSQALSGSARPLFEATLQHDGVLVRVDLLLPEQGGYRLAEVKSSTKVKDNHYEDAAVQAWVARGAGISITAVEIAHINSAFVYPGGSDYRGLLIHADITEKVVVLESEVPGWAAAARTTLAGARPEIEPASHCHKPFACPFLAHCQPAADKGNQGFPPELLPYGKALAAGLRAEGFSDLRDVPGERFTNPRHQRIWRTTVSGKAEIGPAACCMLATLSYPRHYIDFETVQFPVPIWAGTRPYAQIPFQWSCHTEFAPGITAHEGFLAEGQTDPRRDFAESLLKVLGPSGRADLPATPHQGEPVLVYNQAFESTRIRELANAFPDLSDALHAVNERVVDLLPITRDHYYHPDMRGSWSIKAVLPTVAPQLSYANLPVADGRMAQTAFLEMLHPEIVPERLQLLREGLAEYCALDTLAMLHLTNFFLDQKN